MTELWSNLGVKSIVEFLRYERRRWFSYDWRWQIVKFSRQIFVFGIWDTKRIKSQTSVCHLGRVMARLRLRSGNISKFSFQTWPKTFESNVEQDPLNFSVVYRRDLLPKNFLQITQNRSDLRRRWVGFSSSRQWFNFSTWFLIKGCAM